MPPARCKECRQLLDDPDLKIFPGDPEDAVSKICSLLYNIRGKARLIPILIEGLHDSVHTYTRTVLQHLLVSLLVQCSIKKNNKKTLKILIYSMEGFEILAKCVCWYSCRSVISHCGMN